MTPQERQLVAELFDRLASLEKAPRDPEAMQAIEQGLQRAPSALYALVQSVLVQDEALKNAGVRIRELESELGIAPEKPEQGTSFLGDMREDMLGRREPSQGSVPSVRPGAAAPISNAWRTTRVAPGDHPQQDDDPPQGNHPGQGAYPPQGNYPAQGPGPSGGSFLGTAAATAAGVIGGTLLMNSLRGMMGGNQARAGALDPGGNPATPSGGNASGSDLARQAGVNDIGGSGRTASAEDGGTERAGLFDSSANDSVQSDDDDVGYENDGDDFDDGGDSDDA
jgi:hypothetical protein